ERVNLAAAVGKRGDRFQHGIGAGGRSAIHQQDALAACVRNDSGFSRDADDVEIVGEVFGTRVVGLRRCAEAERRRAKDDSCRPSNGSPQEFATRLMHLWVSYIKIGRRVWPGRRGGAVKNNGLA